MVFLPKQKNNRADTTRPITINNTDNRVIASTLARVVLPHVEAVLSAHQSAVLPGRDILDNVELITSKYYASLSARKKALLLLTDFSKAFDSVHHRYIHALLKSIKFPPFFRQAVAGLLTGVKVVPAIDPSRKTIIAVEQSVKQGCPLSPLLFILASS